MQGSGKSATDPRAVSPTARKATVGYGQSASGQATVAYGSGHVSSRPPTAFEAEATMLAEPPGGQRGVSPEVDGNATQKAESAQTLLASASAAVSVPVSTTTTKGGRSTVLPRMSVVGDTPRLVVESRERYEEKEVLGAGGVGEVIGARDHDIGRDVAIKRLLPEMQHAFAITRFVDEIRTVGRLEHPNIVPIHDVGVDDRGRYFFVMKRLQGETLESIIAKLAAGDREAHSRYSFERRAQIFMGILEAVNYAHQQGILHRDIKPANVMVGRYGEVVVMDWGIAKRIGGPDTGVLPSEGGDSHIAQPAGGTVVGSLLGTPAYMSPEQARGENDTLDVRSDVYSLCALFWELLALRHYLGERKDLNDTLAGVIATPALHPSRFSHPVQGNVPADLGWYALRGLEKDPALRYQSVDEMILRLQRRTEGVIPIQCPLTFTKRITGMWIHFVDRHPAVIVVGLTLVALWLVGSVGWGIFYAARAALGG